MKIAHQKSHHLVRNILSLQRQPRNRIALYKTGLRMKTVIYQLKQNINITTLQQKKPHSHCSYSDTYTQMFISHLLQNECEGNEF